MAARGTFNAREISITGLQNLVFRRRINCREVVAAHLARIRELDRVVNSVIALNGDAIAEADALDAQLAATPADGYAALRSARPLFGVPVLVKDNCDAVPLATSSGSLALQELRPTRDAGVVRSLRAAGAVVLGKTNMHELALEGLSVSSLGGQTLNAYDSSRTPGGSSGGSGAALAASFAVLAVGTDTMNSLRSPASASGICAVRPTRGLIGRTGIAPVSLTQDVVGPMARTVPDLALALGVMVRGGADAADPATAEVPAEARNDDYLRGLAETDGTLRGLRLGLLECFLPDPAAAASDPETTPVSSAMEGVEATFEAAGATVVPVPGPLFDSDELRRTLDTQRFEFRDALDAFLQRPCVAASPHPKSLRDILASGQFLVIPAQYPHVNAVLAYSAAEDAAAYSEVNDGIESLKRQLAAVFDQYNLDALIYPQQKHLVVKAGSPAQNNRNGMLAALTGSPVVAVPMGYSTRTQNAPCGVPMGLEILGRPLSEKKLLQIAYTFEQCSARGARRVPSVADSHVDYRAEASVSPGPGTVPPLEKKWREATRVAFVYPLGTISSTEKP